MKENLKLLLEHVPNPMLRNGYYVDPKEAGALRQISVQDELAAQIEFCRFIGSNGLSGSNLTERSGLVVNDDGIAKMRIRFSGDLESIDPKYVHLEPTDCELNAKAS